MNKFILNKRVIWATLVFVLCLDQPTNSLGRDEVILAEDEFMPLQWCISGKRYSTVISHTKLSTTPRWLHEAEDTPITTVDAFKKARDMLKDKLGFKDETRENGVKTVWVPLRATLEITAYNDADMECFWQVEFEQQLRPGATTGPPAVIKAIVLMNGEAVVPTVDELEDGMLCCHGITPEGE